MICRLNTRFRLCRLIRFSTKDSARSAPVIPAASPERIAFLTSDAEMCSWIEVAELAVVSEVDSRAGR